MRIEFKLEQEKQFEVYHGSKWWFERGRFHRLSGPAIENRWGHKTWYEDDRLIREER